MADLITAAETIRRLAVQFQGIIDVADAIGKLGSIEQATQEANAARAAADAATLRANEKLVAALAQVDAANDSAATIIAKANDQAFETLAEADRKAQSIQDAAVREANNIRDAGMVDVLTQKDVVAGQVAQLTATKIGLEQDVGGLSHAAAAKRTEVDDLEAKLARVQASIAKLLA